MIQVSYAYEGKTVVLTMRGHANGKPGTDNLVCASASTLFGTFAVMTEIYAKDIQACEIKNESGDGMVVVTAKDEQTYGELVRCLMFVITGLRLLGTQGDVEFVEL